MRYLPPLAAAAHFIIYRDKCDVGTLLSPMPTYLRINAVAIQAEILQKHAAAAACRILAYATSRVYRLIEERACVGMRLSGSTDNTGSWHTVQKLMREICTTLRLISTAYCAAAAYTIHLRRGRIEMMRR